MKKVLMIAYSFPPVSRDRSVRTLKFARYLTAFGWQPIVLTVKSPIVPNYDQSLLKDIPVQVKVVRTPSVEFPSFRKKAAVMPKGKCGNPSLKARLRKALNNLLIPDSRIGWIPFVILYGKKIIREESVDIIYASGEPFSSFISAAILKKLTALPLILDFRDDWVGFNPFFRKKRAWLQSIELFLERFVVKSADAVIAVNDNIKNDIKLRHYGQNNIESSNKFYTIYNGLDREDFDNIKQPQNIKKDVFRIVYTGSLYPKRSAKFFLKAVYSLIMEKPYMKSKLRVLFAGNNYNDHELFDDEILKEVVIDKGFLPYQDVLSLLKSAHLLLFIEDQVPISNRIITGKIFDYMGARKPILALAKDGLAKEMVNSLSLGRVVDSEAIDEIKRGISDFFEEFIKKGDISYGPDTDKMLQFERKEQVKVLAQIMNKLS